MSLKTGSLDNVIQEVSFAQQSWVTGHYNMHAHEDKLKQKCFCTS